MRKVAVFTGTRAEYGLLQWVIKGLHESDEAELQLIVGGMHLSPKFGHTVDDIVAAGWPIAEEIDFLVDDDSAVGISASMGRATTMAAEAFERLQPDVVVILGDRFEAIAVALAAMSARIPIAHIHGGEVTEGAMDDVIRHALTKLSHLHFATSDAHRRRIIQMGENPAHVWSVGAPGIDTIRRTERLSQSELADALGIKLDRPYLAVTYHPVTLGDRPVVEALGELLTALDEVRDVDVVITYPNADSGGREIVDAIEKFAADRSDRIHAVASLGRLYLSLMSNAAAVVGNSSSGIIEAPSLRVPTLDIGDRQKGRAAADSVVHVPEDAAAIAEGLRTVLSEEFRERLATMVNPYGNGHASEAIVRHLLDAELPNPPRKPFFDIEVPA